MQTDFGLMLVRLCYSGPLLYIGLSMALDPAGFVANLANLERGITRFAQHMQEPRWQASRDANPAPVSAKVRAAFRIGGAAVAVTALLHLVGLA